MSPLILKVYLKLCRFQILSTSHHQHYSPAMLPKLGTIPWDIRWGLWGNGSVLTPPGWFYCTSDVALQKGQLKRLKVWNDPNVGPHDTRWTILTTGEEHLCYSLCGLHSPLWWVNYLQLCKLTERIGLNLFPSMPHWTSCLQQPPTDTHHGSTNFKSSANVTLWLWSGDTALWCVSRLWVFSVKLRFHWVKVRH